MINSEHTCRTHRVGTVTTGICMIVFGVCLLLHSVFGFADYKFIFALWPIILIGLGVELLVSNIWAKQIIYDKGAVVLLFIMTLFAIIMAVADVCIEMTELYLMYGIK